jgi:hypothetical protein
MGLVSLATSLLAFGSAATATSLADRNGKNNKLTSGLCHTLVFCDIY